MRTKICAAPLCSCCCRSSLSLSLVGGMLACLLGVTSFPTGEQLTQRHTHVAAGPVAEVVDAPARHLTELEGEQDETDALGIGDAALAVTVEGLVEAMRDEVHGPAHVLALDGSVRHQCCSFSLACRLIRSSRMRSRWARLLRTCAHVTSTICSMNGKQASRISRRASTSLPSASCAKAWVSKYIKAYCTVGLVSPFMIGESLRARASPSVNIFTVSGWVIGCRAPSG